MLLRLALLARPISTLALALAVLAWSAALPAAAEAAPGAPPVAADHQPGAATPEALLARMQQAAVAGDLGDVAACLQPADRGAMAVGLLVGVNIMLSMAQMSGDELLQSLPLEGAPPAEQAAAKAKAEAARKEAAEKAKGLTDRYQAVLAKYGLTEKLAGNPSQWVKEDRADPTAAVLNLLGDTDTAGLLRDLLGLLDEFGAGPTGSGKAASAPWAVGFSDLKVEGDHATAKAGAYTVELLKIDDRWYFKAPEGKGPPPKP